jgi:hypothetical protein
LFEFVHLLGSEKRSIGLQTRKGRDIPNEVGSEITASHRERFLLLVKPFADKWRIRKGPSAAYNCTGHVWASRRTNIYELTLAWSIIKVDDAYRQTLHPQPDDLAFYVDQDGELLHVARVVEIRKGVTEESEPIPWAVSKWADWTGEVFHSVYDHPFHGTFEGVTVQYWTDRPLNS